MECSNGHSTDCLTASQTLFQPLAHLIGSLVGKGNSRYLGGLYAPCLYQIGDTGNQGFGFAGARPRYDRCHRLQGLNRLLLFPIQYITAALIEGIILRTRFRRIFHRGFLFILLLRKGFHRKQRGLSAESFPFVLA